MTTNWNQENFDCSTRSECRAERYPPALSESLVPRSMSPIDEGKESRSTSGRALRFVGPCVTLATLAGTMIIFFFFVASISVLDSASIWVGVVIAVGLGPYLWGRVFSRRAVQQRHRVQD